MRPLRCIFRAMRLPCPLRSNRPRDITDPAALTSVPSCSCRPCTLAAATSSLLAPLPTLPDCSSSRPSGRCPRVSPPHTTAVLADIAAGASARAASATPPSLSTPIVAGARVPSPSSDLPFSPPASVHPSALAIRPRRDGVPACLPSTSRCAATASGREDRLSSGKHVDILYNDFVYIYEYMCVCV